MDKETRELFNALAGVLDRVEQKICGKLDEINSRLDAVQRDVKRESASISI